MHEINPLVRDGLIVTTATDADDTHTKAISFYLFSFKSRPTLIWTLQAKNQWKQLRSYGMESIQRFIQRIASKLDSNSIFSGVGFFFKATAPFDLITYWTRRIARNLKEITWICDEFAK